MSEHSLTGQSADRKTPRICPECGGDRWKAREAERNREAAYRQRREAEKIAEENGLLRYKLRLAEREAAETAGFFQRKITRQARVIRRLEERLKALDSKPYEDAGLGETAPGAEYDAAQEAG